MNKLFGLIDCNNFYATCERVFNPKLIGKPIVILSNNDGCVIARSNEAKLLGIPMGEPVYKWKEVIERNNIHTFSANFELYGDMSSRVMNIIRNYVHDVEIYSIDEAFLDLENIHSIDYENYCRDLRKKIIKETGIFTSIGIARTKTLAKLGNKIAKKGDGVCRLITEEEINRNLKSFPVLDIWGVGWNYAKFLNKNGIYNALALKNVDERWAKESMSIVGQRTVLELRGIPCFKMGHIHTARKSILSSRSFGNQVKDLNTLSEAVTSFVSRASEKLREDNNLANFIHVSIRTGVHSYGEKRFSNYTYKKLPAPTSYLPELVHHGLNCLREIFVKGYGYKKASVMLTGLVPNTSRQMNFYQDIDSIDKQSKVMKVFDHINSLYGSYKIKIGTMGNTNLWKGKRENVTNRFTTKWDEILTI